MSYASYEDLSSQHSKHTPSTIHASLSTIQASLSTAQASLSKVKASLPIEYDPRRPVTYQPSPIRFPESEGALVPMTGTNPIRGGMLTSVYPSACSQYGSSLVQVNPADYYGGSPWCNVGILMNNQHHPNSIYALEARFIGNSWAFRARDALVGLYIYIHTVGNGPYGAYRTDDRITIPGKEGVWTIQIQTQHQPYLLYVPV
jgi:hypothetical protein